MTHKWKYILVHVEENGGFVKSDWNGRKFVLNEQYRVKTRDLKKTMTMIDANKDLIVKFLTCLNRKRTCAAKKK